MFPRASGVLGLLTRTVRHPAKLSLHGLIVQAAVGSVDRVNAARTNTSSGAGTTRTTTRTPLRPLAPLKPPLCHTSSSSSSSLLLMSIMRHKFKEDAAYSVRWP